MTAITYGLRGGFILTNLPNKTKLAPPKKKAALSAQPYILVSGPVLFYPEISAH
jgi:hypothetical protein